MYESPISIIETAVQTIMEQRENTIVAKVQDAIDVQVDKGELLRALQYDRGQYDKGYADGKADATPKWIPVTERLPEEEGWYQVYTAPDKGYKSINKAMFRKGFEWDNFTPYWHGAGGTWGNVTHWMPLPEPPEGE